METLEKRMDNDIEIDLEVNSKTDNVLDTVLQSTIVYGVVMEANILLSDLFSGTETAQYSSILKMGVGYVAVVGFCTGFFAIQPKISEMIKSGKDCSIKYGAKAIDNITNLFSNDSRVYKK